MCDLWPLMLKVAKYLLHVNRHNYCCTTIYVSGISSEPRKEVTQVLISLNIFYTIGIIFRVKVHTIFIRLSAAAFISFSVIRGQLLFLSSTNPFNLLQTIETECYQSLQKCIKISFELHLQLPCSFLFEFTITRFLRPSVKFNQTPHHGCGVHLFLLSRAVFNRINVVKTVFSPRLYDKVSLCFSPRWRSRIFVDICDNNIDITIIINSLPEMKQNGRNAT